MVPVVHIVGTPPTASQASGAILHHTLGNGDYRVFANMYKEVTVSYFFLDIQLANQNIFIDCSSKFNKNKCC
jgi:pyruvate decarboxylase